MNHPKKKAVLKIYGLHLQVHLGCTELERNVKQAVTVNVEMHFDSMPAAVKSDNLTDTICFDGIIRKVQDIICTKQYNLIEHMGNNIFEIIKKEAPDVFVRIIVSKAPKIEGFSGIVAFELEG
jgi:FolB domain-containing protein